jgi:hypothetical protein
MPETTIVTKTRTIVTLEMLAAYFPPAFEAHTGAPCEPLDLAIIYGKLVNECGHPGPGQNCWLWNIGNVRGKSKAGVACILAGAYELADIGKIPKGWHAIAAPPGASVPAGKVACLPDNAGSQLFRAYPSLAEASPEYVEVLDRHFPKTLRELTSRETDPTRFVLAMKSEFYFTGDPAAYVRNVGGVARANLAKCVALLAREPEPRTKEYLSNLDGTGPTRIVVPEAEHTLPDLPAPDFD